MVKLSVMCKYVIRKILSRWRFQIHSVLATGAGPTVSTTANLDAALEELYPDGAEAQKYAEELERLSEVHQKAELQKIESSVNLDDVERSILWIFGLQIRDSDTAV